LLYERFQERNACTNDSAVEFDCREDACFGYVVSSVGITDHTVDVDDADGGYDDYTTDCQHTTRGGASSESTYPDPRANTSPSKIFCLVGNCKARNMGIGKHRIKKSVIMFIHAMNRLRSVRHFWSV
jgi:hypothetical protein